MVKVTLWPTKMPKKLWKYKTTNHWSNWTENWVLNNKNVYHKKENHPPVEKFKGIKWHWI